MVQEVTDETQVLTPEDVNHLKIQEFQLNQMLQIQMF